MVFYRRRLPHWVPDNATVFVTWRLAGSLPAKASRVLLGQDERLDRLPSGPVWLQDGRVASMVVEALQYGETVRQFYHLYAWVIMPNHVHVIFQPRARLASILRWLKGRTSRRANQILGRTGTPFWQDESFDHWVRSAQELEDLIAYVECNPVKAGLVEAAEQWPWSSAGCIADGRRRNPIVCPTMYCRRQTTKPDRLPHDVLQTADAKPDRLPHDVSQTADDKTRSSAPRCIADGRRQNPIVCPTMYRRRQTTKPDRLPHVDQQR